MQNNWLYFQQTFFPTTSFNCQVQCLDIEKRMILFWIRIFNDFNSVPSKLPYINNTDTNTEKKKFPWFHKIQKMLIKCGLPDVWRNQHVLNPN